MKKSDIAAVVLIASVSMLIAFFLARALIGSQDKKSVKVKVVDPISSNIVSPSEEIFNEEAINPTVEVIIGIDKTSESDSEGSNKSGETNDTKTDN